MQAVPAATAVSPTAADPTATDMGLLRALWELRQRTRCNDVSGCPAEEVVRGYGPAAIEELTTLVRMAGPRTPWLPRVVRLLGEVGDARTLAVLEEMAELEEDAVRASALFALTQRGVVRRERLLTELSTRTAAATSRSRLTAAWALGRDGDANAQARFVGVLQELAEQIVAADSLRWGYWLCGVAQPPSCTAALEAGARHPGYLVRREVLRLAERRPTRAMAPALRLLMADPMVPLRRDATATVRAAAAADPDGPWSTLLAGAPPG